MSFRMLAFNSPPLVTMAGISIISGVPLLASSTFVGSLSIGALKAANIIAFATNVAAVSIPGRMDDMQNNKNNNMIVASRNKSLVTPAGWAFAIWGPIYLGETIFCASMVTSEAATAAGVLPEFTVPFVAANLLQSLWCASFRPSYMYGTTTDDGTDSSKPSTWSWWHKYVSVMMLGGTAFSLSNIPFDQFQQLYSSYYLIPIVMHFGWTTAATLVNLNGSLAIQGSSAGANQERLSIAAGHASSLLATILGVGVTLIYSLPVYGFTISWALAACANGIKDENDDKDKKISDAMKTGAKIQKMLLSTGSMISAGASIYTLFW